MAEELPAKTESGEQPKDALGLFDEATGSYARQ